MPCPWHMGRHRTATGFTVTRPRPQHTPISRTATGATVYVQQELSDARLHVEQLKYAVVRALNLVNASQRRDHLYAVAGDLIHGIPMTIQKLERALDTAAMAVNKIDYEELRQVIRPEKVDELERVLEEVRLHIPRRTGRLPFKDSDD
ncbi:hypothetical protein LCGC14_2011990 [marine sediment metagenome]|uniref:Uncharacterized protein n=1 Tax=marine sediment metagenome TaxID=412755 RepID=A0A0F9HX89_9ZZZZ